MQDKACPSVLQYYLHLIPLFYSNWKSKENEIAVLFFESSASQNLFFPTSFNVPKILGALRN